MKLVNILIVCYLFMPIYSFAASHPPKLSIEKALPILETIKKYAIHIGKGKSEIYVFVDPLCPHSRDFMDLIIHSKKMQSRYSYYIFMYELKRFNSLHVIESIYTCKDSLACIKKVMLEDMTLTKEANVSAKIQTKIDDIALKASELNVYKRPYLIINKVKKRGK